MKKILIFQLKNVCYNSYIYFTDRIGKGLSDAGYEVDYFRLGRDGTLSDIEQFLCKHYDAVLEFNSDLPKIYMEDDSLFLNHMDAPFFDFILDHPLYHHDMLKQPLHNFHVICLDDNHKQYILDHYSHIKSVHVLPLTGNEYVPAIPFEKRSIPLLFTGTYTVTSDVLNAIDACPSFLGEDIRTLIDMMLADSSLTLEKAVAQLAADTDSLISTNFALHMQAYFLADTYLRSYLREKMIVALLDANIPLTIYGSDWERLPCKNKSSLTLHKGVPFEDSFKLMSNSKITLNVMPLFKSGSHDRVFSSMLNHSVCLTDTSDYFRKQFTDGKDIVMYDISDSASLVNATSILLADDSRMQRIAETGYHTAVNNHTWDSRISDLRAIFHAII